MSHTEPIADERTEALDTRVERARLRLLFAHVPSTTMTAGAFAVLIVLLVGQVLPEPLTDATWQWLTVTLVAAVVRTVHALVYLRYQHCKQCDAAAWHHTFLALTLIYGGCWGTLVWVLPLDRHLDLASAIVGSVTGIAAAGVSMLNVDRTNARAWLVPSMLPCALFSASIGGAFGWFGFISVTGFLIILWIESDRSHRRVTELLRLRYESEELAQIRTRALHEAESLGEAKGRFLATMSHEMRTPLHGILGLSRILRADLHTPSAQAHMTLLQKAGEHLLGVINDVLDFSRLKEGLMELRPRTVDLTELARDVCTLADVNAQEKGIVVMLRSTLPAGMRVQTDPDRLKQILINLLGNAVKFTQQGHVTLRISEMPAVAPGAMRLLFEVEDTGVGIPPNELHRVFDAFHQVDARDERRAPGSGLGLSIAQQICMAMGSEITCQSQLGVGTTFRFVLDLPHAATTSRPDNGTDDESTSPEPPLNGMALVVEDNPVNAMVAQATLEKLGMHVAVAENGRHALDWLDQHRADVVLMDCHMPEMGGIEATRRIRALEVERGRMPIPIVAMSASSHIDDHRACLAAGMDDYIAKPFTQGEVLRVVRRHLLRRREQVPVAMRA